MGQAGVGGSGGEGVGQVAETESTLALAENVYVGVSGKRVRWR